MSLLPVVELKFSSGPQPPSGSPGSRSSQNIALNCVDLVSRITQFLEPFEVARCEAVCKLWKMIDHVWREQAANFKMTKTPKQQTFKELFKELHKEIRARAFGRKEWQEHFKVDPGITPPISGRLYMVFHQLKEAHLLTLERFTITLIPHTINGKPLCFKTFAPLAEQAGMKLIISDPVLKKYGEESSANGCWVWMQKDVKPKSRGIQQEEAEKEYPGQLGRALHYAVSIVAHYVQKKICLLPDEPKCTYTRTRDGGEDGTGPWFATVGGSAPGRLRISHLAHAFGDFGVVGLFRA